MARSNWTVPFLCVYILKLGGKCTGIDIKIEGMRSDNKPIFSVCSRGLSDRAGQLQCLAKKVPFPQRTFNNKLVETNKRREATRNSSHVL